MNNNIIKILQTPEGLKYTIRDKIYHGLEEDLRYLLHDHPDRYVVSPETPEDFEEIVIKSSKIDEKDETLKKLLDQIYKLNVLQEGYEPLYSNPYYNNPDVPDELKNKVLKKITEIIEMQISHYKKILCKQVTGLNGEIE